MRAAVAVFLLAVACLAASSLARLSVATPDLADPRAILGQFEDSHRALTIEVGRLYAGRIDLLDPRLALPTWHRHAWEEASRVHFASAQCPPPPLSGIADASLARAYGWQALTCHAGLLSDEVLGLDEPPFLHPSGRSYAALALAHGHLAAARVRDHEGAFHVLELASLDPEALSPDRRALAAIPAAAWGALLRGDSLVFTPDSLVAADHGPFGLARLRIYRREQWADFAQGASVALAPRPASASCARRASPDLCWEAPSLSPQRRKALVFLTIASALVSLAAALVMVILSIRDRRRAHQDRIHVLRTLTHELRTPATSLRFDIEPLRAAFDELPASCQEPLLRISDGVERLLRVLHRSARYMALFETPDAPGEPLVRPHEIPSARALFEELAEEWPEEVSIDGPPEDSPLVTDPEWLGLAIRNLVENGLRHGQRPLRVSWSIDKRSLVVRVIDRGTTPGFSLRRAVTPFVRAAESPGLGLGLAIVERVAHLLGGRLSHEPSPTAFILRVPGAP